MFRTFVVFFTLVSLLLLTACSREADEKPVGRSVSYKIWGKDFVIQPAAEASPQQQEWGRAVAQIRAASGGTGTGFFVSADGLFISNEHVLPRNVCSEHRCGGIQIVRHLAPGGDFQVFNRFTVILQSKELDFALVKVDLPPGTTVPFLELDTLSLNPRSDEQPKLVVIGHPAGAALRVTDVDFAAISGDQIQVRGPVFWGNSGSPLIDSNSGRVVGLVSRLQFGANTIDREGAVGIVNEALRTSSMLAAIGSVYPIDETSSWTANDFALHKRRRLDESTQALIPRKAEEFKTSDMTFESFMSHYFGTPLENVGIEELVIPYTTKPQHRSKLISAIHGLNQISLLADREPAFSPAQASVIEDALTTRNDDETPRDRITLQALFRQMSSGSSWPSSSCASFLGDDSEISAIYWCRSTSTPSGQDAVDYLYRHRHSVFYQQSPVYQDNLRGALQIIEDRLNAGPLRSADTPKLLGMLEQIANDADLVRTSFRAEALHALLQKDPALVGRGSFKETF